MPGKLVGNRPLLGTRTPPNTLWVVALFMSARIAIQFGLTHFLEICRGCYRVLTASPPMRISRPGPLTLMISAHFYPGADSSMALEESTLALHSSRPAVAPPSEGYRENESNFHEVS